MLLPFKGIIFGAIEVVNLFSIWVFFFIKKKTITGNISIILNCCFSPY